MKHTDTLIIGAGLAGLGCALKTEGDFLVCEKNSGPGGLCRTNEKQGFLFDTCAHLLHFRAPEAKEFIIRDLGIKLNTFRKHAFVRCGLNEIRHPFQYHLSGLTRDEAAAALLGFVNTKLNPLYPAYYSADTFHDWLMRTFGTGICKSFMLAYNEKFWKVPLKEMTCEWVDKFIAVPTMEQVIEGAMLDVDKEYGYNSTFMYPERGGISQIAEKMAKCIEDRVLYKKKLAALDAKNKIASFSDGTKITYKRLVLTLPLPELANILTNAAQTVTDSLGGLDYLSVININFATGTNTSKGRNWVYCPEPDTTCFRFGFPDTYSACAPEGKGNVYTETTCLPGEDAHKIKEKVIEELEAQGIVKDIEATDTNFVRYGYVIFNRKRQQNLSVIRDFAKDNSIHLCGRYGTWDYMSMEESLLDGMRLALKLNQSRQPV